MYKIACITFLMTLSVAAMAGTPLSGEQVKQLITGNSVDIYSNVQGVDIKLYFAADGSTASLTESNGKKFKGTWRIDDSGKHCTKWGDKKETCGQILDYGDGTYKRMEDGYPRAVWKKIYPGNAFGL